MKLDEKRRMEQARHKVNQKVFTNLISPLTDKDVKKKILEETARRVFEGKLKTDEEIRKHILDRDSEQASDRDIFKTILKIAPAALIIFILFIFLIQSFWL